MNKLEQIIRDLIIAMGEDPNSPELKETPRRIADLYRDVLSGKEIDIREFFARPLPTKSNVMTVISNIEFVSLCPHHFWPFFGKIHIAVIPHGRIVGLSKYISAVRAQTRRLQLQETISEALANVIEECLEPYGTMVIVEGFHTCMLVGGKYDFGMPAHTNARTKTSALRGVFLFSEAPRNEALRLIYGGE